MRSAGFALILVSAVGLTGCIIEPARRPPPPPSVEYDRRPPPPPADYDRRPPPPGYQGPPPGYEGPPPRGY